jgi:hypothetical protein
MIYQAVAVVLMLPFWMGMSALSQRFETDASVVRELVVTPLMTDSTPKPTLQPTPEPTPQPTPTPAPEVREDCQKDTSTVYIETHSSATANGETVTKDSVKCTSGSETTTITNGGATIRQEIRVEANSFEE